MNVTIDRQRWLRGSSPSFLLHPDNGKMCCLGFVCKEAGYTDKELNSIKTPAALPSDRMPARLVDSQQRRHRLRDNSPICIQLMTANDSLAYSNSKREEHITSLFASIGITVTFIN